MYLYANRISRQNDQKAFYWLLHHYRDKQLEDFKPELAHSMSDYHHMKPSIWKKRVSTCQFSQPRTNGHGRSISRFTVISNAAEDTATVVSYDPYRASGKLKHCDSQASQTKVVVHRDGTMPSAAAQARARSGSNTRRARANSTKGSVTGKSPSARGSMTSLNSRQGTPQRHVPSLRHKRAVDFSHVRKRSNSTSRLQAGHRPSPNAEMPALQRVRANTPGTPKRTQSSRPASDGPLVVKNASALFREELRHFSNDIARNCDEAFNSALVEDDSVLTDEKRYRDSTPFSFTLDSPSVATEATEFSNKSWQHRPLPPLPGEDGALSDGTTAAGSRPSSGEGYGSGGEYVTDSAERRAISVMVPRQVDRRSVSAPTYNQISKKAPVLPSIYEHSGVSNGADKSRIVSAPTHAAAKRGNELNGSMEYLSKAENTIRVVNPAAEPAKETGPQLLKKRLTKEELGRKLHLQIAYHADKADEPASSSTGDEPNSAGIVRKKRSWFRRVSKTDTDNDVSPTTNQSQKSPAISSSSQEPQSATTDGSSKKRAFSFPFWKSNRGQDAKAMADGETDHVEDDPAYAARKSQKNAIAGMQSSASGSQRNIDVKQNWLTRLFRVKPATSYICMTLSRRRARQEISLLFREWRRYGMRDIQVDKQRNIIFARVAAKNYLNISEVSIAAEVITVIEHGKRQPLCIVRFTQERGAASSFHRVVDTMRLVFDSRNLVVTDRAKQKMMVKTLTSAT